MNRPEFAPAAFPRGLTLAHSKPTLESSLLSALEQNPTVWRHGNEHANETGR